MAVPTRWWGWGSPTVRYDDASAGRVLRFLAERLGAPGPRLPEPDRPPREEEISPSRLTAEDLGALRSVVGEAPVSVSAEERVRHSFGRSLLDELALRQRKFGLTVDAVVRPARRSEVERVVALAADRDIAVIPWGAGSTVVGGVAPDRGSHRAVISLSLEGLTRLVDLRPADRQATFEAGILGPDLERVLNERGFTLGHFPQSFEHSTLGGWVVTRGSGQASTRYGTAADRLVGGTLVTPRGTYEFLTPLHEAVGPQVRGIVAGSEGIFGVLTQVSVRIDPQPERTEFFAALLEDWETTMSAVRSLATGAVVPAVLRASDREETELTLSARAPSRTASGRLRSRVGEAWVNRRRAAGDGPTLVVVSYEGDRDSVERGAAEFRRVVRGAHGLSGGATAGEEWRRERFRTPYLRETLLSEGWLVETVETGASWSSLGAVRTAVRNAVREAAESLGVRALVGTHLSHPEPGGASLYSTVIVSSDGEGSAARWTTLKQRLTDATVRVGGSLSHHHGVGVVHRPWVARTQSPVERALLARAKAELDPHDIMNPGKTLAPPSEGG